MQCAVDLGIVFFELILGGGFFVFQIQQGKPFDFVEFFDGVFVLLANTINPVGNFVE